MFALLACVRTKVMACNQLTSLSLPRNETHDTLLNLDMATEGGD